MDKFGKLQLKESQEGLDDAEMKMIIGGYVDYGSHVISSSSCTPLGGVCQGACPDYEYQTSTAGGGHSFGSKPRYCVPTNHVDGPAVSCICATKDATAPWG